MENGKLKTGKMLRYNFGSIGLNMASVGVSAWILFIYQPPGQTSLVPVAFLSAIGFIAGLWDGVIDPFIGTWSDNVRTRWGRRKPFILFGTPVMIFLFVFIWMPPTENQSVANGIWLLSVLLLYRTAFSCVGMPYDAVLAELAPRTDERVTLSSWKMVFGILGYILSMVIMPVFSGAFGMKGSAVIVSLIVLITMYISMGVFPEHEKGNTQEKINITESFRYTFSNRDFLFLLLSTVLARITWEMILSLSPFFVTQIIGWTEDFTVVFQGGVIGLMLLSIPFWHWIRKKISDKYVLFTATLGLGITMLLNFFIVPKGALSLLPGIITFAATGIFISGYMIMSYAMMGNVVDSDERRTGRRREAVYYGAFSFAVNLGGTFAMTILPLLLGFFGNSAEKPLGIRLTFVAAGIASILGALALLGYSLPTYTENLEKMEQ
ncbi:MAG: MFS transporter [Spirochaetales bacterium]|nr:MFS transporter [Spirochaetales bacterium]